MIAGQGKRCARLVVLAKFASAEQGLETEEALSGRAKHTYARSQDILFVFSPAARSQTKRRPIIHGASARRLDMQIRQTIKARSWNNGRPGAKRRINSSPLWPIASRPASQWEGRASDQEPKASALQCKRAWACAPNALSFSCGHATAVAASYAYYCHCADPLRLLPGGANLRVLAQSSSTVSSAARPAGWLAGQSVLRVLFACFLRFFSQSCREDGLERLLNGCAVQCSAV